MYRGPCSLTLAPLTLASLATWALVVAGAVALQGRGFATFIAVLLGVHTASALALADAFGELGPLWIGLQAATYLHFLTLARPRMRPRWWRALVAVPASYFVAAVFLAIPWAIAAALGLPPVGLWIPFALAGVGLVESLWTRAEIVDVVLDGVDAGAEVIPYPAGRVRRPAGGEALSIVQITDPHLGPFMSERRLRRICARAVERAPDLILLTGDFLTIESHADPELLVRALAPLAALEGRVFACLGNHDYEAPETVLRALRAAGATLLVDREAIVQTRAGPVQILGFDFVWRDRERHLRAVCARHPRRPGHLRLALLHDPGAFRHLPTDAVDLVFSGHTHGGQVGLVSFGLGWTVLRALSSIPDHGLWARGRERLYVHRGTGHYGFPVRAGVPAEESLIRLHLG
ncbi:MAG: metallophosphoesterase [Myxococcales bacterium]|nr:metallophosphoesterase [Myxococcales bacterium]